RVFAWTGGQPDVDGGSPAVRACDRDRPAERIDPILEPDQSGPAGWVGAADAVVRDLELDPGAAPAAPRRDRRCLRVLDGVRDRLRCDVVNGGLERRVIPAQEGDVEVYPNRASPCESAQRIVEAGVGEDRRVDAA